MSDYETILVRNLTSDHLGWKNEWGEVITDYEPKITLGWRTPDHGGITRRVYFYLDTVTIKPPIPTTETYTLADLQAMTLNQIDALVGRTPTRGDSPISSWGHPTDRRIEFYRDRAPTLAVTADSPLDLKARP